MNISDHKRQDGIQGLRAIACFAVLIQHVTYYACITRGVDYRNFLLIDFGRVGVFLFFIISGFVMGNCLNQGASFLWKRAVRIYPPLWIAAALSYLLLAHAKTGWHADLKSLLLIPTDEVNNSYGIPYWTLCYEVAFYCVTFLFALFRIPRRQVAAACAAWLVAIFVFDTYRHTLGIGYADQATFNFEPGWWILLSPVSTFYVLGLLASAAGLDQLDKVRSPYLAVAAIFLYSAGTNGMYANASSGFGLLAVSFLIVLVLAQRLLRSRALARLGDYSYGAYLIHVPIVVAICTAITPRAPNTRLAILWLLLLAASVIGGVAFGAIEYRLHRQVFKRSPTKTPIVPATPA